MSSHLPSSTFPPPPSGTTSTSQRPLTLTSELERIEQSITLTLQEIDAHFSLTHRILTTSILPLVARYGDHSQSVWESTKFWKQFFEASANVSLSGYEEEQVSSAMGADASITETETETEETTTVYDTTNASTSYDDVDKSEATDMHAGEDVASPSLVASTPRPGDRVSRMHKREKKATMAGYPSPYEQLVALHSPFQAQAGQPLENSNSTMSSADPAPPVPHTPMARLPRMDMRTPAQARRSYENDDDDDDDADVDPEEQSSSPFSPSGAPTMTLGALSRPILTPNVCAGDQTPATGGRGPSSRTPARGGRLMHRVLDKNYRLLATPHSTRPHTETRPSTTRKDARWPDERDIVEDDSLMSSPEMPAPTLRLRSEIFSSPARKPGVSVLESRPRPTPRGERYVARAPTQRARGEWSSSDEDDTDQDDKGGYRGGMDPPSRIKIDYDQPDERIFRTPAREASRKIVDDILYTAGGSANDKADPVNGEDCDDFEIDMTLGADGEGAGDGDGDMTSQVIKTRDRAGRYGAEGGGGGRGQGRQTASDDDTF